MRFSIKLEKETKSRLERFGSISMSHDTLINEILDHLDECDRFWSEKE